MRFPAAIATVKLVAARERCSVGEAHVHVPKVPFELFEYMYSRHQSTPFEIYRKFLLYCAAGRFFAGLPVGWHGRTLGEGEGALGPRGQRCGGHAGELGAEWWDQRREQHQQLDGVPATAGVKRQA